MVYPSLTLPAYLTWDAIRQDVQRTLVEDLGPDHLDLSACFLPNERIQAHLWARTPGVLCGQAWVVSTLELLWPEQVIDIEWRVQEGQWVPSNTLLATFTGSQRKLLSAERTCLNWLQTLSGTATVTHQALEHLKGTATRLLDTRKTLPGLRYAQKYAVLCGGGHNHRLGLFDRILFKENHIRSAGGVTALVQQARIRSSTPIQIEVTNLSELQEALALSVDAILLDNFSLDTLRQAVQITAGRVPLEASGGMTLANLAEVAATGVDYISMGSLTKDIHAWDLSLQFHSMIGEKM